MITGAAILAFSHDGRLKRGLAANTFVVPHGLSIDGEGCAAQLSQCPAVTAHA